MCVTMLSLVSVFLLVAILIVVKSVHAAYPKFFWYLRIGDSLFMFFLVIGVPCFVKCPLDFFTHVEGKINVSYFDC